MIFDTYILFGEYGGNTIITNKRKNIFCFVSANEIKYFTFISESFFSFIWEQTKRFVLFMKWKKCVIIYLKYNTYTVPKIMNVGFTQNKIIKCLCFVNKKYIKFVFLFLMTSVWSKSYYIYHRFIKQKLWWSHSKSSLLIIKVRTRKSSVLFASHRHVFLDNIFSVLVKIMKNKNIRR